MASGHRYSQTMDIKDKDKPILLRPGVTHREADFQGNAKHITLPPESILRSEKGDLGNSVIPDFEPRPLSHAGKPFVLKSK